ncbi:unnamed protein product [Candidula unifasciata]|uniref:Saposin B-type domain-containing protein n=1 Tax=Candidula unifasciata TaxID=100452 RepID=A0A8S3YCQ4_9EUPU|nr:unnamed protein product [Candidula unifasciata]
MGKRKAFITICAVLFSILTVSCSLPGVQKSLRFQGQQSHRPVASKTLRADLCPLCIQFTDEALDVLLNIILNSGIVGSCGVLCNALEQKTGSKVIGAVCNILCDIAGIKEFIKIIEQADLDPIYFCELLKVCAVFDGGDATITKIIVSPQTGPQEICNGECGSKHPHSKVNDHKETNFTITG